MKNTLRILGVIVLAMAAGAPAARGGVEGAVHLGDTGDIRALHMSGGTLWIATGGGLFRYDVGNNEVVDHLTVGDALPSNSVRAINSIGNRVLVGTDAGLVVFDGGTPTVYTDRTPGPYDSLVFDDIRAIDTGRDDTVYLCTYGHGVGVMTPDECRMITREDSLLDDKVYGVVERWSGDTDRRAQGAWYYATSMGLCAYRDSAWVGFQAGAGIPRGEVRRLFDWKDSFLLLVGVGGVYRFNGYRATDISPLGVLPEDDIADIAVDSRGIIWAAGRFGGLAVYQGGNWKRISEGERSVNEARWRCAYADGGGGVFFGSADGLVASVRDNILRTFRVPQQLPSGAVRSLVSGEGGVFFLSGPTVVRVDSLGALAAVEPSPGGASALAVDANGDLWVAGRWGLYQRRVGQYTEFLHDIAAVEPAFTSLCFDGPGRLWTALRNGAVYRFDGELWVQMGEPGEVLGGPIDGLRAAGSVVWAFSEGGVARFDGRAWVSFPADSIGGAIVDVALGPAGAVVAATAARLWLYREDSGDWQPVSIAARVGAGDVRPFAAPPSRAINRVAFDDEGNMYLATEGGLGVIGAAGVRWLGARDGIGGTAVVDVLVEGDRAVWLGFRTDGMTRIPFRSLW